MATETPLRADAARNRELILAAAREVFSESGLGASMRQIAQRAGVGEPTLRRRFGSKEELIAQAFEDKIAMHADFAKAALENPDPVAGFREFLSRAMDMQLVDRGFADVLTMTFPATMRCEQHRRRSYAALERLIAKAQNAGGLRRDFVAEDVVLVLLAHAGIAGGAGKLAKKFSARLQAFLFEAFGLAPATDLPPAPSASQVYRVLRRLHDRNGRTATSLTSHLST